MRPILLLLALAAFPAQAAERLSFWNLTADTITSLTMAPAGTNRFGPNQCTNDKDGTVDHDERLRLSGIEPGRYDVRLTDKRGRSCLVRNVEVKSGGRYAFSLSEQDLTECTRR
ncbi:MAG TPA: hypothetical protein VGC80_19345 [Acetobacteraceae bacterium]